MPPNPDRLILTSTPHPLAIRRPIHRKHLVLMSRQILRQRPGPHIPRLQRRVLARAHQQPGVGGEGALVDGADMAAQGAQAVARCHVPDAQGFVAAGGHQEVAGKGCAGGARRDEAHRADAVVVARQRAHVLVLLGRVPQFDGEVGAAAGEEGVAAGPAEVDVQDGFGVGLERALQLAELVVPDLDRAVFAARRQAGEERVEGDRDGASPQDD